MVKISKIVLDIDKGDTLLGGRFKNMKTVVEDIGTDDLGQPTINGKKLLSFRILKNMPNKKVANMTNFERGFMDKLAQMMTEQQEAGPAELPPYAARSNYTCGQSAKTSYNNLARSAHMCASMFNVANGNAKNVRSPKPLPAPQPEQANEESK
jgi:hypothetical protein